MELSFIIPVFNADKFLTKCLESVFSQDLKASEYEVIVINDGSSDLSRNIILDFKQRHLNLIFLDQENRGVSEARNAGLEIARGKYITFLDSDDEIELNSLQQIVQKLEDAQLDMVYPNIDTYLENGNRLGNISFDGTYDEVKKGIVQERRTFPPTFYRKELLRDICFDPSTAFGEDTVFNAKAQALADRVCFINVPYYRYTVRENSLSKQGRTPKAFSGFISAISDLHNFQQKHFGGTDIANPYFDNIYEIFVTRILELNVMPAWNRGNYDHLLKVLEEQNLMYILHRFSAKYPYVATSFDKFKVCQRYRAYKSKLFGSIYPLYHYLLKPKV